MPQLLPMQRVTPCCACKWQMAVPLTPDNAAEKMLQLIPGDQVSMDTACCMHQTLVWVLPSCGITTPCCV
jgi:hypothetical protein